MTPDSSIVWSGRNGYGSEGNTLYFLFKDKVLSVIIGPQMTIDNLVRYIFVTRFLVLNNHVYIIIFRFIRLIIYTTFIPLYEFSCINYKIYIYFSIYF